MCALLLTVLTTNYDKGVSVEIGQNLAPCSQDLGPLDSHCQTSATLIPCVSIIALKPKVFFSYLPYVLLRRQLICFEHKSALKMTL